MRLPGAVVSVLAALAASNDLLWQQPRPAGRFFADSGPAYQRPSRVEEPAWPGKPEGARICPRASRNTLDMSRYTPIDVARILP